jgi:ferredoxin--NADP+ reductase
MNDLTHGAPAPAPRSGFAVSFTVERVASIVRPAPTLAHFETTRPPDFRFTPGHYARLGLGPDDDVVWRPFSIASPAAGERLAFQLTRVSGGAFNRLFEALAPGDAIRLDWRAFGFLTLGQVAPGGTLWLIATGTGVAPFLSIVSDAATWMRHERVIVVHSVRHAAELATAGVAAAEARITAIPVVTRESCAGALHARIGELARSGALEEAAGRRLEPAGSRVMLCGNPEMIRDMRAFARERGFEPGRRGVPGTLATEGYW